MKNYFYGINKTANIRSNYYSENRNILSSDNSKLARYSSVGAVSRQSGVDTKILNFGAIDSRLTGAQRTQVIEDRMRQINEVTKNNPNFKMTPEAYKAIFEGEAFQAKLQLNAPDRRNLAITGALTLVQLGAALATGGNSGFNSKQAEIMTGRAQADAEFVTKYGNNYNRGFLGIGAQFQDGNIEIVTAEPRIERAAAQTAAKKVDANIVAKANQNRIDSTVSSVDTAGREQVLSVPEHRRKDISGKGTIENDAYKSLGTSYLKAKSENNPNGLTENDLKGTGLSLNNIKTIANDIEAGKKLSKTQIDLLRNIGFSVGQDNGGGQGVVTSIIANEVNLRSNGAKGKLARTATEDYLQLAVGAGLLKQEDLNNAKGNGAELYRLFNDVEKGLSTGKDAYGKDSGIDPTNLKVDHLIGGQHITNLQFAVNQRIKQNTDAGQQINDVINGKSGATISATTAAFYDKANPGSLKGSTAEEKAQDLQRKLASGDLTGVSETLKAVKNNINDVRNSVLSVAGGLYSKNNAVLAATLNKTNETDTTTSTPAKNFFTGIKGLRELIASRQSGGTGTASVDGGTSVQNKSIAAQANGLVADFKSGKVTSASQDEVIKDLTSAFSKQLKANGVEVSPGVIQDVVKAVAQGKSLDPAQKELYETGKTANNKTNISIGENFLALVALEKAKVVPPPSAPETINNASQTIGSNSAAVSQAATTDKAKPEPSEDSKLVNKTFAKYDGTPLWKLTMDRVKNESEGNYGENLPAAKNKFQALMRGLSNILDQGLIKSQDGSDPKSLSDAFVSKMLEIADELLRKSVAQYSYGFADSASISTSNYNKGSDTPLSDMYNMTKAVGVGIQNGIRQADKYTGRRDDEKQAEGEKIGLAEAMAKYKKAFDAQGSSDGTTNAQILDVTTKSEEDRKKALRDAQPVTVNYDPTLQSSSGTGTA